MRTSLDSAEILILPSYALVKERLGKGCLLPHSNTCGADRVRTDDIQLAKLALSQLSYSPSIGLSYCHETLKEAMLAASPGSSGPLPGGGVVGLGGLEPPTSRLSGARSSQLSYRPREAGRAKRENPFQHPVCQRTEHSSAPQNQIASP